MGPDEFGDDVIHYVFEDPETGETWEETELSGMDNEGQTTGTEETENTEDILGKEEKDEQEDGAENDSEDNNSSEEESANKVDLSPEDEGRGGLAESRIKAEAIGEMAEMTGAVGEASLVAEEGFVLYESLPIIVVVGVILILALIFFAGFMARGTENAFGLETIGAELCSPLPAPDPSSTAGFVHMPTSEIYSGGGEDDQWGTPETVAILNAVLSEFKKRHPDVTVYVGDLSIKNGGDVTDHASHETGLDVDISSHTCPSFTMDDSCYDKNLSIELAKLFFETKAIDLILYNDTSVNSTVTQYAKDNSLPGTIKTWSGHENHFHVRIKSGLYSAACGF